MLQLGGEVILIKMNSGKKMSTTVANKKYEVVHRITRDGDFLSYTDYHRLICQIREPNSKSFEPLGAESVELGVCTIDGNYPGDYRPFVRNVSVDGLARKVAQNFPYIDGDEVGTHSSNGINFIQYPLEDNQFEFFKNKLLEWTRYYHNS